MVEFGIGLPQTMVSHVGIVLREAAAAEYGEPGVGSGLGRASWRGQDCR